MSVHVSVLKPRSHLGSAGAWGKFDMPAAIGVGGGPFHMPKAIAARIQQQDVPLNTLSPQIHLIATFQLGRDTAHDKFSARSRSDILPQLNIVAGCTRCGDAVLDPRAAAVRADHPIRLERRDGGVSTRS